MPIPTEINAKLAAAGLPPWVRDDLAQLNDPRAYPALQDPDTGVRGAGPIEIGWVGDVILRVLAATREADRRIQRLLFEEGVLTHLAAYPNGQAAVRAVADLREPDFFVLGCAWAGAGPDGEDAIGRATAGLRACRAPGGGDDGIQAAFAAVRWFGAMAAAGEIGVPGMPAPPTVVPVVEELPDGPTLEELLAEDWPSFEGERFSIEVDRPSMEAAPPSSEVNELGLAYSLDLIIPEVVRDESRAAEERHVAFDLAPTTPGPGLDLLGQLPVAANQFWTDYLGPTFAALEPESRTELIDATIAEYLIQAGITRTWTPIVLSLCRVAERELATTFFVPHRERILAASFRPPGPTEVGRAQARQRTFDALRRRAAARDQAPTLGELLFMLKFWRDPVMDAHTTLFAEVRAWHARFAPDQEAHVAALRAALESPLGPIGNAASFIELRNAAAHGGRDAAFDWAAFAAPLKATLGTPPRAILQLACVALRAPVGLAGRADAAIADERLPTLERNAP